MNIIWAIVIGLVASIVGGILSGLFVVRKMTHDNRRSYARQPFYFEIRGRCGAIRECMLQYLYHLGCIAGEIGIEPDEDFKEYYAKLNRILLNGLRECLETNRRQWTSKFGASNIVPLTNQLVKNIDNTFEFDDLSIKYPLQVSHFDKLYDVSSYIEGLNGLMDLPPSPSNDLINATVDNVIYTMLSVFEELNRVYSELEYYRKAKAWTWRLFIPTFRN